MIFSLCLRILELTHFNQTICNWFIFITVHCTCTMSHCNFSMPLGNTHNRQLFFFCYCGRGVKLCKHSVFCFKHVQLIRNSDHWNSIDFPLFQKNVAFTTRCFHSVNERAKVSNWNTNSNFSNDKLIKFTFMTFLTFFFQHVHEQFNIAIEYGSFRRVFQENHESGNEVIITEIKTKTHFWMILKEQNKGFAKKNLCPTIEISSDALIH